MKNESQMKLTIKRYNIVDYFLLILAESKEASTKQLELLFNKFEDVFTEIGCFKWTFALQLRE